MVILIVMSRLFILEAIIDALQDQNYVAPNGAGAGMFQNVVVA